MIRKKADVNVVLKIYANLALIIVSDEIFIPLRALPEHAAAGISTS